MKKLFVCLMIAGLVMFGGNAIADTDIGTLGVDVSAIGGGVDGDFATIPNGMAGGISGAGGLNDTFRGSAVGYSNTSVITVFGLGYSTTQAMMRDKPWIQANALKAPKKITKKK